MAILIGGARPVDNFSIFSNGLLDLTGGTVNVATPTAYRITNGTAFDEFTGTFVYDGDGRLINGTITGWRHSTSANDFTVTGLNIPVTTFLGQLDANNTAAFLSAVFDGADTMSGSAVADAINGFGGNDKVSGLGGDDLLAGDAGNDTLDGGKGNDGLTGGIGDDNLTGGVGDDSLQGDDGDDTMAGGAGNDFYIVSGSDDVVIELLNQGTDTIQSDDDFDLSAKGANVENLTLTGTADNGTGNTLNNRITGNDGDNSLSGGDGNDTLIGGKGADTVTGGKGDDTYEIDKDDQVIEAIGDGTDTVRTSTDLDLANDASVAGTDIENLVLLTGALVGKGNALNNSITGNSDDNTLDGAAGKDTLTGGGGFDTYIVDNTGDKIVELAGPDIDTVQSEVDYTLAANVEVLELLNTGTAVTGTGNTANNTISGNKAANKLFGLAGADLVVGEEGNDTLDGGAGNDQLVGGLDDDSLLGGTENDNLQGGAGKDILDGGAGNDSLLGGDDSDEMIGGAGDDLLNGGLGDDTAIGGIGNDSYFIDAKGDSVIEALGQGTDSIGSSIDIATLFDNVENLTLLGAATLGGGNTLNNQITGSDNSDSLLGDAGNDTLSGAIGADTMDGGTGDDMYEVDDAGDKVTELAGKGSGTDTIRSMIDFDLGTDGANVENLTLLGTALTGTGNILANVITGNDKANTLEGAEGNDSLLGGLGDDSLTGDAGADTMAGGKGDDKYVVDDAGDKVVELAAQGTDLVTSKVNHTLAANVENLELIDTATVGTGNASDNKILSNVIASQLFGLGGSDTLQGNNGNSTLDGGVGNDLILGGDGNETLVGGAGNDTLNGGLGDTTMIGGVGDDLYTVGSKNDEVFELMGQGIDTIQSAIDLAVLFDNVENLTLVGTSNSGGGNELNNQITGTGDDDTLLGAGGNDTLIGGAGADKMAGDVGDDVYDVDDLLDEVTEDANEGKDTIRTTLNTFTLATNFENLVLLGAAAIGIGNAVANVITGNDGNNTLQGDAGNDSLSGGAGFDSLEGGDGADTMAGGLDDDRYDVDNAGDKIVELADGGIDHVRAEVNHTLAANVEHLTLTGTAVTGIGNAANNEIAEDLGGTTANKLFGLAGDDSLEGVGGDDTLDGGVGNDFVGGGDGNDSLIGGAGNDNLAGDAGNDTMVGGAGNDSYLVADLGDVVTEGPGQGTDEIFSSIKIAALAANVENLSLLGAATLGGGNALSNKITGTVGADSLIGFAGNDTLAGLGGDDTMAGGIGNDVYSVDSGGDVVAEKFNQGIDTIRSSVSFNLSDKGAHVENLELVDLATDGTGNELANKISGNANANFLVGRAGNDSLVGGADNDTLDGGIGADTMVGGTDSDRYIVDSFSDKVVETAAAAGIDEVASNVDNYVLAANVENLTLEHPDIVTGFGNAGNNIIEGNDVSNKLFGLGGNDAIFGRAGNNTLDGGTGNDTLFGGNDGDSLIGGAGNDKFDGVGGDDTMLGGAGDDYYVVDDSGDKVTELANQGIDTVVSGLADTTLGSNVEILFINFLGSATGTGNDLNNKITDIVGDAKLDGAGGNDTLVGGEGTDEFTGGTGRDSFVIDFIDVNKDTVTDFKTGASGDTLDISAVLTGFDAGLDDPNEFVKFVDAGGDTTVQVDVDGAANGVAFVDVVVLQGVTLTNVNQAVVEGNLELG